MADLSVFSNIEMRDEHMKLLEMNANTFWDYIAHEDFGTTRIFPKEDQHLLDGFKWITGQSVIYYLDLNVLVVRFPIVGILGIIGFIVGIRGYFTFSKYSTTLCLSFLYFSGMCSTAALLHSFVPFSYIYFRRWLTYLDLVCSVISGLFLTISLYSMTSYVPKKPMARDKYLLMFGITSFLYILSHFPQLQDYFLGIGYLSVFVSSSYTVCVSSLCKEMDRDLWKIGMFGAVIFGMMVLFMYLCPMLCPLTNGKFNVGIVAMGATTFGFIIVQHYASKFYERKQKTE
eukprot:204866_1